MPVDQDLLEEAVRRFPWQLNRLRYHQSAIGREERENWKLELKDLAYLVRAEYRLILAARVKADG